MRWRRPSGKAVAARLVALAREHESRVLQPFGVRGAQDLKKMLLKLIAQCRAEEEPEIGSDAPGPAMRRAA